MQKNIKIVWDNVAKEDLKGIYKFNHKNFSIAFAKKVRDDIYKQAGTIVFLKQWQADEILGLPYRRVLIRNYKIVYLVKVVRLFIFWQSSIQDKTLLSISCHKPYFKNKNIWATL